MHKRAYAVLTAVFVVTATAAGCAVAADAFPVAAPGVALSASAAGPADAAPRIAAPPASIGTWYDLGAYQAPWLAGDGPVPVSGPNAPTHVAGWKREADPKDKTSKDQWLAIVIAQVAPGEQAPCSTQATSLDVTNAGAGCLRLRRDVDFDHWIQAAQPVLYRWVDDHGWTSHPRAWAAYRLPSADGRAIEVHVLLDPSLIEPTLRNTTDFVTSGQPGQQWARQLAAAVRTMDDAAGNVLVVPPFPFAPAPPAAPEAVLPDVLPDARPHASAPAEPPPARVESMPVPDVSMPPPVESAPAPAPDVSTPPPVESAPASVVSRPPPPAPQLELPASRQNPY